jgi:glucose/arabinose dehydrogenase
VPREGRVVLLGRDRDADGLPDDQRTLLSDLNRPHGLDLHAGLLYVAEADAVLRVPFDVEAGALAGVPERIVTGLPSGGNHWTRTVRVGPDEHLYVSVGSSCNVCFEDDPRRAAILRYRLDGSGGEIFARGLRNAVGFDWRPADGALYATDNGRDLLGDDLPPCELNRVVEGGDYGWPVAFGDRRLDPDLGAGHEARAAASIPPVHAFRAHNAPLGIRFLRHDHGEDYRDAALVALHGSWNRTRKDGYEVVSLHFRPDGRIEERPFVQGFLEGEDVIGRPVDVTEGADGSIFVSDDYAGVIYRVTRGAPAASLARHGPADAGADPLAGVPAAERAAAAERGALLYERYGCFECHDTTRARKEVVPVVLKDLAERHDLADLEAILETPTPPMPAFPYAPGERRDLAVYLLTAYR